jgi:hypothetical protein
MRIEFIALVGNLLTEGFFTASGHYGMNKWMKKLIIISVLLSLILLIFLCCLLIYQGKINPAWYLR